MRTETWSLSATGRRKLRLTFDIKMKTGTILTLIAMLCASCSSPKWGIWTVEHEGTVGAMEYRLLRHEQDVILRVERNGELVGEFDIETNSLKAVVGAYELDEDRQPTNITILSDGRVLRWVRSGADKNGKWMLLDKSGDGPPDKKVTRKEHESVIEEAQTTFKTIKRKTVEPEN